MWEKQGEEVFFCFVDLKKAFDTIPREELWHTMEELDIPKEYRAVVYKLYEQVKEKFRTKEGMSKCFGSDIGIKQGCSFSSTLFGLYIDKLEEWLNKANGEGIQLAGYVIKLLLYADDLILIAKTAQGLRKHLKNLETFCLEVGMEVTIAKTKVVIFSLKKKKQQHTFIFEGSSLEIVENKYLGIDFHYTLSWETHKSKRIHSLLQNRCRKAE